jgi:hypothetical protein
LLKIKNILSGARSGFTKTPDLCPSAACSRMLAMRCALLVAASGVAFPQETTQTNEGPVIDPDYFGGPTELQDTFLPSQLRYQSYPESARVLKPDGWSVTIQADWTAHLAKTDTYLFDGESITSTLKIRHSPWEKWEVGIDLPYTFRIDGSADEFIEFVETILKARVPERYELPRDTYQAVLVKPDNSVLNLRKQHGAEDLTLRFKRQIVKYEDHRFDAAVTGTLSLPTGSENFGGEGVAPGLSLNVQKPLRHWLNLYGGAAGVYYSDNSIQGWKINHFRGMTYAGLAVKPKPWFALLAEYQYYTAFAQTNPPLDDSAHYYSITGRFYFWGNASFETGIVENLGLVENRNSSDVTFKFALKLEF